MTYSSAYSSIAHNEETDRLAKIGDKNSKKIKNEKITKMATVNSKAKSLSLQTWATRWERKEGKRYQYLVPENTISTLKQRKKNLKYTSSSMVWSEKYSGSNVGTISNKPTKKNRMWSKI